MPALTVRFKLMAVVLLLIGGFSVSVQGDDTANPLGDLLRRLDRGIRQTGEDLERARTGRDLLDLRPVQRTEQERRLRQAKEFSQSSRWHDAIEILQFLIEEPHDAFFYKPTREFGSLHDEADQQLKMFSEEGLRNYLNHYAPAADRLLEQASKTQDLALLRQVFNKYRQTPAGQTAMELAARILEDQGEFAQAASLWEHLVPLSEGDRQLAYRDRGIQARLRAGQESAARKLGEDLSDEEFQAIRAKTVVSSSSAEQPGPYGPFLTIPDRVTTEFEPTPVLSARWEVGLIERFRIQRQLQEMVSEMEEREVAPIPSLHPLVVDGRLVIRSLRGLQVRDLKNGTLLWEHRSPGSPEELLSDSHSALDFDPDSIAYQDDATFSFQPLANLAFKDENFGSLSSDGVRLFSVEVAGNSPLGSETPSWNHYSDEEEARRPPSTNELAAYDLEDGDLLWRVGGVEIEDQFSRPLAGTFFLGPPVPGPGGLFVLGERDEEVTLFCLSAQTGEELWSQPLTVPGRPIGSEQVRGQWICRPVIADGLVICPTGCGWIVAVDLATQRLHWARRFSPRVEQRQSYRSRYNMQTPQPINRRWHATVPIVAGDRLLFTPPEYPDEFGTANPSICCLDIQTGKTLWEQIKSDRGDGTSLYLAGHWNDLAILVSQTTVSARRISGDGEIVWTAGLRGRPTGRGVIVNDKLLIPVTSNRLVQINLALGKFELAYPVEDQGIALGNLAVADGKLVSMNAMQVAVFPLGAQADDANQEDFLLVKQDLNAARQHLTSGDWKSALTILDLLSQNDQLTDSQRRECQLLRFEGNSQRLLTEKDSQATLRLLEEIAATIDAVPRYQRLVADHLQSRGNWSQAVSLMLDLFEQSAPDERITEDERILRIDSWIGGRLYELFQKLPDNDAQSRFAEQVAQRIERLPQDRLIRDRWARALWFHRHGQRLEWQLAQQDIREGRSGAGLVRTQRLNTAEDPVLRVDALRLQAEVLSQLGWDRDSLQCWERLLNSNILTFSDGLSVAEVSQAEARTVKVRLEERKLHTSWDGEWELERLGLGEMEFGLFGIPMMGSGFQELESLRLLLDLARSRLRVVNLEAGQLEGAFPLRQLGSSSYEPQTVARRDGPFAVIFNQGVLQSLNWADRRIDWSWTPELKGAAKARATELIAAPPPILQTFSQFLVTRQQYSQRDQAGYLLTGNHRVLLLHCRDWIALDPITGEELWRDKKAPTRATAIAVGNHQFAIQARNLREIRRDIDGLPVADELQQNLINRSFGSIEQDYLILKRNDRESNTDSTMGELQRVTSTGKPVWSREVPVSASFLQTDRTTLVWLSKDDELYSINLLTGHQQLLTKVSLPQRSVNALRVLSDAERFYLLIDQGGLGSGYISIPWMPVSGSIQAISRQGESLWTYTIPTRTSAEVPNRRRRTAETKWPMRFLLQKWRENPLLILGADIPEDSGEFTFHQIRVVGLDKRTGKVAIDWENPSESGGFSYLHVDLEQRRIELRTYNERLLISVRPKEATSRPDSSSDPSTDASKNSEGDAVP